MTQVFNALGESNRAAMVSRLARLGPQPLGKLVEGLPVTRQAATRHLHVLRDARVVRIERRGREQLCSLDAELLKAAELWIRDLENAWDRRMDALQRHLDAIAEQP